MDLNWQNGLKVICHDNKNKQTKVLLQHEM